MMKDTIARVKIFETLINKQKGEI
jgi:hypothetical protein